MASQSKDSVKWHQDKRIVPLISSSSNPIPCKTWLGLYELDVHAEPLDIAAIPFNARIIASESIPLNPIDNVVLTQCV